MEKHILKQRRIRFKHKNLIKSNDIRIIVASGRTYIESIPKERTNELNYFEMEKMYNTFIQLGRDLYNANIHNLNKIIIGSNIIRGNLNKELFNIKKTDQENEKIIHWLEKNVLDIMDLSTYKKTNLNYFILNNGKWKETESLINWLRNYYIPDVNEGESIKGKYIMYDDGFFIDLAIFMYLTIYSILNQKNVNSKIDKIHFKDFIKFENINTNKFELSDYMYYMYEIISFYEKNNIHILNGYDKVVKGEKDDYKVIREYENLYGILWFIFKLNVNDIYLNDDNDCTIEINPCIDCGIPILSKDSRCDSCEQKNIRNRKRKSQQRKKDNIEKIKSLISNNKYSDNILKEANCLVNKSFRYVKSKEINTLLIKMERYHELLKENCN